MPITSLLDTASDYAFAQHKNRDDKIGELPIELQTVVIIYSVQGIIDNGGLQYLFESDFPGNPPYQLLVDAYRRIGALGCANALEAAVALFQFSEPQLDVNRRSQCLSKWDKLKNHPLAPLHGPFEEEEVWRLADKYVRSHRRAFKIA